MAGDSMQFTFSVIDRMSGPLDNINKSLAKVDGPLKKAGGGLDALGKQGSSAMGGLSKSVSSGASEIGAALSAIGTAALAGGVVLGGLAAAGAKWMGGALIFKEDSLTAFSAMLGSEEAGDRVFKKAMAFASKTPFKTSEVISMSQSLLTRGFKENELDTLMKGVGDVGAALGTEKMDSVINALGKMRANGKLTGETLQMMADAGINSKLVFSSLATQLGKTEEEVKKMMSAGLISDAQGIQAAMDAIAKGLSGGELGGMMDKKSKTLSGLWSTLSSMPEELLFNVDLSGMIGPIQGFLKTLIDVFGAEGPGGKAISAFFSKVGELVGRAVTAISKFDFAGWIERISNLAGIVWPLLVKIGEGFSSAFSGADTMKAIEAIFGLIVERFKKMDPRVFTLIGKALGAVLTICVGIWAVVLGLAIGFGMLIDAVLSWAADTVDAVEWLIGLIEEGFTGAWDFITGLWDSLTSFFVDLGSTIAGAFQGWWDSISAMSWSELGMSIVQGIINGLLSMVSPGGGAMTMLADALMKAFTDKFQIASPSKVTTGWGGDLGQGIINGLGGSSAGIASVLSGLVKTPEIPKVGAVPGPGQGDTGPTGLFGAVSAMAPLLGGPMGLAGMAPGLASLFSPSPTAAPAAPGGGLFDRFAGALGMISPDATAANMAQGAIQPAAASGPAPGSEGMQPQAKDQTVNLLSGLAPVFHITGVGGGEEAGRAAAASFTDSITSALKGIASRLGG